LGNDGFFGIGISELVMIAVIALVVLGPERLPSTMRSIAKFLQQVRGIYDELTSQFSEELKPLQDLNPQKMLQEFTDQLTAEEATKAKPAATQPPSVKPIPASPAAAPVKAVPQPVAIAPVAPSAPLSTSETAVATVQPVSSHEFQAASVVDSVTEK